MIFQDYIKPVIEHKDLSESEAVAAFEAIMSGNATPSQIAGFIIALRMKGESVEEIAGAAQVMRSKSQKVVAEGAHVLDTCGTGGDGADTFNISTVAALIAASAGATVAKHGNRSVSSKCGSADVLEALGINVSLDVQGMQRCIAQAKIGFLFAPTLHAAMKHAMGPRKELGVRTIFNILGPLTNPATAPHQLLGVFSAALTEPLANVLKKLGSTRAFVVHGKDGLDEISLSGPTQVSELKGGQVKTYTIRPEDFGFSTAPLSAIKGGDAQENAEIIRKILGGESGPRTDIALLNAAFALTTCGVSPDPEQGIELARAAITEGKATQTLQKLIQCSSS